MLPLLTPLLLQPAPQLTWPHMHRLAGWPLLAHRGVPQALKPPPPPLLLPLLRLMQGDEAL